MLIKAVKTKKIIPGKDKDIFLILGRYVRKLKEKSVVAVTSKIIAICQGRVVDPKITPKDELVKREADWYLPRHTNKYNFLLTIKDNTLVACAGIDQSNGAGNFILWPKNLQKTANAIRAFLKKKFKLKNLGVIITDSKLSPLRKGTTGVCIAHSGFSALNDYRRKPDLFGRKLKMTQANMAEGLAAAAVAVMGEGKEQTPIVIIENIPFIKFQKINPTKKELKILKLDLTEDLYGSVLTAVRWRKK